MNREAEDRERIAKEKAEKEKQAQLKKEAEDKDKSEMNVNLKENKHSLLSSNDNSLLFLSFIYVAWVWKNIFKWMLLKRASKV